MTFDPDALPVPDLGLLCRGCGHPLATLPEHRCPECGRTFTVEEYIPPGDFPFLIVEGKEVRPSQEVIALLRQARIPYMEMMPPAEAVLSSMGLRSKRPHGQLTVQRDMYFHAIDLLRRRRLGELVETSSEPDRPDWNCPSCNEENPGTFEVCWNCGHAASPGPAGGD